MFPVPPSALLTSSGTLDAGIDPDLEDPRGELEGLGWPGHEGGMIFKAYKRD